MSNILYLLQLWPDKFQNKTNGVTPRRWIRFCNPYLSDIITNWTGTEDWVLNTEKLAELRKVCALPDSTLIHMLCYLYSKTLATFVRSFSSLQIMKIFNLSGGQQRRRTSSRLYHLSRKEPDILSTRMLCSTFRSVPEDLVYFWIDELFAWVLLFGLRIVNRKSEELSSHPVVNYFFHTDQAYPRVQATTA